MSLRNWFARNPAVAAALAILILGGAIGFIFMGQREEKHPGVFYYDLTTKELVSGPPDEIPPIKSEKGNDAARAFVFACGSCSDKTKQFIGYLENYTLEGKEALNKFKQIEGGQGRVEEGWTMMDYENASREGRQVASGEAKDTWVVAESAEGKAVIDAARAKCPAGELQTCQP